MTYEETLHYLYTSIPVFQNAGPSAYKPGLGTSIALDDHLGNPHKAYKTIHVAGTNGKGSVSHLLAAILRQSGYKVGLYTSPHLVDFRERIRVNGQKIPEEYVIDFVERHRSFFETLDPSFFELTSSMAFDYFRAEKVDYAVIEVGMGGRLDSTNIITPILSIITNISLDHTQFLGDTVEKIAFEKAGIIKKDVPAPAQAAHLFLLQHLEQLGLERRIHGVDLIQEERAAVRLLQEPLPGERPRVTPLLRAEKEALQQCGGDGRAVL